MPAKKAPTTSAPAAAPVASSSTSAAPKAVAKAPKADVAAAPAPAPVAAVAVVPAADVAEESPLTRLTSKVGALAVLLKEVQAELKVAQKEYEKLKKASEKAERKRANARTSPSGFAKPTKISDELCGFLAVTKGTEMSRTDVTRHINKYVKEHGLFKKDNKRVILPNATLKKLLGCKDTDEVTYFNLQKWMKHHFVRATVA